MILDFEERKQKAIVNKGIQALSQTISTAALIDITQELNSVFCFMHGMQEESGGELFTAQDPQRRADLIVLAHLCELHGNNLSNIASYAKKAVGKTTAAEKEKAGKIEQALEQEDHKSILRKWFTVLTDAEEGEQ